ncbi:MAG: hypothetical protein ACWA5W_05415 [Phycisphaerales bacterium]
MNQSDPNKGTAHSESTPVMINWALRAICALVALTTLPWMWLAIGHFGGFAWGLFGFELLVLLGSIMTLMVTFGKVQVTSYLPMAIACLIGTLLVSAVFGLFVDAKSVAADDPIITPWIVRTLSFRLLMIALLSVIAAIDVYRRNPRSWGLALRGVLFLIPVLAVGAWVNLNGLPSTTNAAGEPSPVGMIIILLSGLGLGVLFSIAGHLLIRSFEVGFEAPTPEKTTE